MYGKRWCTCGWGLPHAALAKLYGVDRSAVSAAIREVRPRLAARGFAVPDRPGVRLRTMEDVFSGRWGPWMVMTSQWCSSREDVGGENLVGEGSHRPAASAVHGPSRR